MKNLHSLLLVLALLLSTSFAAAQTSYVPTAENLASRADFAQRRFGIFLHWGLYSTFAQGEWYMTNENISATEYAKAANAFYPHSFDARAWMRAFKDAGAGYVCFTTRHHEGFSMWDTKQSDYNIMNTPLHRDVLREIADAAHAEDLRLHLYYSHIDWTRPDYPSGRTGLGTGRDETLRDWPAYYRFMNRQLEELLTQYGRVDAIWFDGWWDHDEDEARGLPPFDWQLPEQYALIHRLQPACLVGNNHHQVPFEGEDLQIFERDVPGENEAGLSGQAVQNVLPLETCQTMNGMWGYKVKDQNYKSTSTLIRLLVRTAAKGANLLLNIGPQPDGNLPAEALKRLKEMGVWLRANGESIYGTTAGGVVIPNVAVSTRRENTLYLHILADVLPESITLPQGLEVKQATRLSDGAVVAHQRNKGKRTETLTVPQAGESNPIDCILKIELK